MSQLPQWKYDAISLWMLEGAPTKQIAEAVGCAESTVHRLANGENETFNRIHEGYRQKVVLGLIGHRVKLLDYLDDAYGALKAALTQDRDKRLAFDAAKDLFDRLFGDMEKTREATPALQINQHFHNPQVQAEFKQLTVGAANFLESLRGGGVLAPVSEDRHLLTSKQALPSAIANADEQARLEEAAHDGNGSDPTPEAVHLGPNVSPEDGHD